MKRLFTTFSAIVFCALFTSAIAFGQISLTTLTSPVTDNFDGMSTSATATVPTGFKIGTDWATGTTVTTLAYGTSGTGIVTGTSSGGVINWANGITASATDRSLGFLTTGTFTSPRSIVVKLTNNTGSTVTSLAVAFDYEKSRSGTRQFDWTFFHGNTTSPATSNTGGDQSYPADANNTVVSNPPLTTSKSFTLSGLSIANGTDYYLRWTFTGLAGSSNGQGIGLDNFSVTPFGTAPLDITTASSMPNGALNQPYTTNFAATGGVGPYTYAVTAGAAPTGLTLNTNGTWSGMPTIAGTFNFDVTVTDSNPLAFIQRSFGSKLNPSSPNAANTATESFSIMIPAAPTASTATVRGRVVNESGRGLSRATISVLDTQTGVTVYARTNQLGYFTIADLPVGNFYIMQTQRKGYDFGAANSFQLLDNLEDLVITGTPNQ
jgi:Carboxypeptidase regulatory-like domain/Putative Ig domain